MGAEHARSIKHSFPCLRRLKKHLVGKGMSRNGSRCLGKHPVKARRGAMKSQRMMASTLRKI